MLSRQLKQRKILLGEDFFNLMMETIYLLGTFLVMILGIRGIILIFLSKSPIKQRFGISFNREILNINFYFFGIVISLFGLLTAINYEYGMVLNLSFLPSESVLWKVPTYLLAATLEEILFRALLFASLITYISNRPLLIFSSLLFSFYHFPGELLQFVSYFFGGIMYGYAFVKFQSILVPIGMHFSWNYFQGALFGYPVSGNLSEGLMNLTIVPDVFFNGGSQGPEGSIVGIFMRLTIFLAIYIIPLPNAKNTFLNFLDPLRNRQIENKKFEKNKNSSKYRKGF